VVAGPNRNKSHIYNMRSFLSLLWRQTRNIDVSVYPKHIVYSIPFDHEPRGILEKVSVENNRILMIFGTVSNDNAPSAYPPAATPACEYSFVSHGAGQQKGSAAVGATGGIQPGRGCVEE
jgi:hypothetical protein